jgi:hypothetical protein
MLVRLIGGWDTREWITGRTSYITIPESVRAGITSSGLGRWHKLLAFGEGIESIIGEALIDCVCAGSAQKESRESDLSEQHFEIMSDGK